jgi:hypothetical protein
MESIPKITNSNNTLKDLENGTANVVRIKSHVIQESHATRLIDSNKECSICLDNLNEGKIGFFDTDTHIFHLKCIKTWLSNPDRKSCPQCRNDMDLTKIKEAESIEKLHFSKEKQYYCTSNGCKLYGSKQKVNKFSIVQCPYKKIVPSTDELQAAYGKQLSDIVSMFKQLGAELKKNDKKISLCFIRNIFNSKIHILIDDHFSKNLSYSFSIEKNIISLNDIDNIMFDLHTEVRKIREDGGINNVRVCFNCYNTSYGRFTSKKYVYNQTSGKKEETFHKNIDTGDWERFDFDKK